MAALLLNPDAICNDSDDQYVLSMYCRMLLCRLTINMHWWQCSRLCIKHTRHDKGILSTVVSSEIEAGGWVPGTSRIVNFHPLLCSQLRRLFLTRTQVNHKSRTTMVSWF